MVKIRLTGIFLWACCTCSGLYAQPALPAIACTAVADSVRLEWRCTYPSVRAISVSRSFDSTKGYSIIGQPATLLPGMQSFTDHKPLNGRYFYRVSVTFSSGLVWHSNHCAVVHQPSTDAAPVLRYVPPTGKVVSLSLPLTDVTDISYILPIHVSLSAATGHVRITLPVYPADAVHSLAFYNMQGQLVVDIPQTKAREFLIDKRNFQRSGTYRFILRRNGVILESAYIRVYQ